MKTVSIISTGSELIYGNIPDENSQYISSQLFKTNLNVKYHFAVGDNKKDLYQILAFAIENSDITILSGGLGPTDDDLTIEVLRQIYNFTIIEDQPSLQKMESTFKSYGRRVSSSDHKMIEIPDGSYVIKNILGLAPGFILEEKGKAIIALPGVPHELRTMFADEVIPILIGKFGIKERQHISFRVIGLKESEVNDSIRKMNFTENNTLWGITTEGGICTLTFVENGPGFDMSIILNKIKGIFDKNLISNPFLKPEEELLFLLKKKNLTLSVAESCTGGLIGKKITDIPGSSEVFIGGIIAYSDIIKIKILGINSELLYKYGAVSKETAIGMATAIKKYFKADIGIAVTGIAGPGGGSPEKPVGTVYFGFSIEDKIFNIRKLIPGSRERVRNQTSLIVFDYLRRYYLQF